MIDMLLVCIPQQYVKMKMLSNSFIRFTLLIWKIEGIDIQESFQPVAKCLNYRKPLYDNQQIFTSTANMLTGKIFNQFFYTGHYMKRHV